MRETLDAGTRHKNLAGCARRPTLAVSNERSLGAESFDENPVPNSRQTPSSKPAEKGREDWWSIRRRYSRARQRTIVDEYRVRLISYDSGPACSVPRIL